MKALELADQLDRHAEHHFDAAQECDMRPCDTRNWEHFETSKHAAAELRRLAAVEASILQAILDPENQPSQYGTVTLEKHANKVSELTDKYCALVDRLSTLKAERDALKAEVLKLHQSLAQSVLHAEQGWSRYENANQLAKGYMAELERIKALEPVAEIRENRYGGRETIWLDNQKAASMPFGTHLYALGSKT